MAKTITLPSNNTVVLRDTSELKQKDRAKLYSNTGSDNDLERGMNLINTIIAILVESWSFDLLPPAVKIDSLGELSIADFDALQAEAEALIPSLFPKLKSSPEGDLDPKAITANFNA